MKEGILGKLIVLEQVREKAARAALAEASEAEARAEGAERDAEARRAAAAQAVEASDAAGRAGPGQASAQVLELGSRWRWQLREHLVAIEVQVAALQGERLSKADARRRLQAEWEASRERRERLEERREAARRSARGRREAAAERERDDLPPRGEGGGDG